MRLLMRSEISTKKRVNQMEPIKLETVTQLYIGKDGCACGCGGEYYEMADNTCKEVIETHVKLTNGNLARTTYTQLGEDEGIYEMPLHHTKKLVRVYVSIPVLSSAERLVNAEVEVIRKQLILDGYSEPFINALFDSYDLVSFISSYRQGALHLMKHFRDHAKRVQDALLNF